MVAWPLPLEINANALSLSLEFQGIYEFSFATVKEIKLINI
jgi:hypothetical protein